MGCEKDGRHCEYTHHLGKRDLVLLKPPTKCYIHALHSRIALLENRLAQYGETTEDSPSSILNPGLTVEGLTASPKPPARDALDLLRTARLTGAYGHPGFGDYTKSQGSIETSIHNDSVHQNPLLVLQPESQAQLVEEFWAWQNNWPILVHQPLFAQDLAENGVSGYCTPAVLSALLSLSVQYIEDDKLQLWNVTTGSLANYAKRLILDQIEHPSLYLTLAAALISLRELIVDNLVLASHYIGHLLNRTGIAYRHALFLGLHLESLEDGPESNSLNEARVMLWTGIWMLERHITQVLGQPTTIRECDMQPIRVPLISSMEYSPLSIPNRSSNLSSHCMSNMQYACDFLCMVSPVLRDLYALSGSLDVQAKENEVTKTHVALSQFYNNLPSSLRLPATSTQPVPPHVHQLNLQYHTLKIMLHHPFIQTIPSMKALQDSQGPHMVHLQSATFSSIRISEIINAYKNFYPLNRLSPFTVQSLTLSSLLHILNASSTDTNLAERSKRLYDFNCRILTQMASTTKCSSRALRFLDSTSEPNLGLASPVPETINPPPPTDLFDWFDLPLNNELFLNGQFADLVSDQACDIDHGQYWSLGGDILSSTDCFF
ncbi:hypothetical protein BJX99DRAFT_250214 [Aspergillus californicus]